MSLPWSSKRERNMFKTIVLALDGSDGAKQAIPVAAELAANEKAKIVIAHVTEYLAVKGGELPTSMRIRFGPKSRRRQRSSPTAVSKRRSRWPRSPSAALRTRSSRSLTATTAI